MTSVKEILLTQAALDSELDAAGMLDFENRLAGNASLAAEYGRLKTLREVMRRELVKPVAPQALRERVARMAAPSIAPRASGAAPPWLAMAASAVLAAGLGSASTWLALRPSIQDSNLGPVLLADHKRGLLSGQPFDIASSDRHTVKPWFAARFALAPKVVDLAAQGFPLAGGRIDVIADTPTPVLIYRHNDGLPRASRAIQIGIQCRWLFRRGLARRRHRILGYLGHRPGGTFKIPSVFRSRGQSRFWSSRLIPTAMRLPAALAIA